MPYITQQDRDHINNAFRGLATQDIEINVIEDLATVLKTVPSGKTKGAFNYAVTRLFCHTFGIGQIGYTELSDAIAVFGDMDHELRRRVLDEYENSVILKNGDLEEFNQ